MVDSGVILFSQDRLDHSTVNWQVRLHTNDPTVVKMHFYNTGMLNPAVRMYHLLDTVSIVEKPKYQNRSVSSDEHIHSFGIVE